MKRKSKPHTEQILIALKIVAWLACFAFIVEAGSYLYVTLISFWNPDASAGLYKSLNLLELRQTSVLYYSLVMFSLITTVVLNAIVWYRAAKTISEFSIADPFTAKLARRLEIIAYLLFSIWVLSVGAGGFYAWLGDLAGNLNASWSHKEYVLMAGLVYIISQIFKRGVEIQSENELTV